MTRTSIVCGLAVAGVLAGAAVAAAQRPVEPGGKIGAMTVVRGDTFDADVVIVEACPSIIPKAGKYHESCTVPKVPRLHIGESHIAPTQTRVNSEWKHLRWSLWVDGTPVDLPRFGTSDRQHLLYGKPAFFRRWKVILAGAPSGRHSIHWLMRAPDGSAIDLTVALTVGK